MKQRSKSSTVPLLKPVILSIAVIVFLLELVRAPEQKQRGQRAPDHRHRPPAWPPSSASSSSSSSSSSASPSTPSAPSRRSPEPLFDDLAIPSGLSSIPSSSTPSLRGSNSKEVRSMEPEEKPKPPPPRLDCIKCFDALWFCYSPVHQMQTYYRHGDFDNCFSKWGDLVDCLALKTKARAEVEEILIVREKARPHIWTYRTVDEASAHWWKLYRHKVMMSSPPKTAGSAAPKKS